MDPIEPMTLPGVTDSDNKLARFEERKWLEGKSRNLLEWAGGVTSVHGVDKKKSTPIRLQLVVGGNAVAIFLESVKRNP
jgi:hypothetical protein